MDEAAVLPGQSFPPEVTDSRVLSDLNAQSFNALHARRSTTPGASIGLPLVDDVRDFIFTDRPWLAADPKCLGHLRSELTT
ncbi:hypothetical protein AB0O34_24980 [Sphaerisporangium sp. NPDC088356]|uniref:hypothetical protein n=1 Tax=Sphaerisporangium sp. NPDC088356 TaxID=3154871 RepID=UPI003440BFCA